MPFPLVSEERARIGEEERAAAMELLRDPRLLDRILADPESCGMVGEETNKLVSYLAETSRLLDAPLAILLPVDLRQSCNDRGR